MTVMSITYLKNIFDATPKGQMLVVLSGRDMLVITEFTFHKCMCRVFEGTKLSKQQLLVKNPHFTNYWYMPATNELVFGHDDDPFEEKTI